MAHELLLLVAMAAAVEDDDRPVVVVPTIKPRRTQKLNREIMKVAADTLICLLYGKPLSLSRMMRDYEKAC